MMNNFSYRNFLKFKIYFELKIQKDPSVQNSMVLIEFSWEPQKLMQFEQEVHVYTWIIDQLVKRIWSSKFESLLDLLQELD
jgi:hypothetical protein